MSMIHGRAGAEPGYDDITYMLDAKYRLEQLNLSLTDGLTSWVTTPPHSPTSTLIAFVSESIFGANSPAIYFVNGIVISVASFFLIHKISRSFAHSTYVTGLLIVSPIGPMLMFNFRPDCLYALTLSLMIMSIREKNPNIFLRHLLLWTGLLILIKPSFIIFTIIDATIVFFLYLRWSKYPSFNLRKLVFTLSILMLMLSWYLINGLKSIVQYIIDNTTGGRKSLWTSETILSALQNNVRGTIDQVGLLFSAVLFLIIVYTFQKNRNSILSNNAVVSLLLIGLVNLGISVYSRINNPFFYLTAFIPFLSATYILVRESSTRKSARWGSNKHGLHWTLVFGLTLALFPANEWSAAAIRSEGTVAQQLATLIKSQKLDSITFLYMGGLNADTTNWYLGEYKVNIVNQGLSYETKDAALQILEETVNSQTTIVTRVTNYPGFPSDELQEFNNDFLQSFKLKPYEVRQIGNYYVWIPKDFSL